MGGITSQQKSQRPACSYNTLTYPIQMIERVGHIMIPFKHVVKHDSLPTILWCHSNHADIGTFNFHELCDRLNANIVSFDCCGYGLHSQKTHSDEEACKDVEAIYYQYVLPHTKNALNIFIVGESVGTMLAIHLAYSIRYDTWQPSHLILLGFVYSTTKPWFFVPLEYYDVFKKAPEIKCKTSIYHTYDDSTEDAKKFSAKCKHMVRFHTIYNCDYIVPCCLASMARLLL